MISLDMISAKIMELVKMAICRMFLKKKKSLNLKTISSKSKPAEIPKTEIKLNPV
jgi:hypothetical protein